MTRIIFSENANEIVNFLEEHSNSKKERMILDSLKNKLKLIQNNPHYGNPIRKDLIPKFYKIKYNANNLFRIELPLFWRMLYTLDVSENEIEIIALIIDVQNHKDYNKKFGYKNK
jgi:plasmid stabilization system protein ParE